MAVVVFCWTCAPKPLPDPVVEVVAPGVVVGTVLAVPVAPGSESVLGLMLFELESAYAQLKPVSIKMLRLRATHIAAPVIRWKDNVFGDHHGELVSCIDDDFRLNI